MVLLNQMLNQEVLEHLILLYISDQSCAVCDVLWPKVSAVVAEYPQIAVKTIEKSVSAVSPAQMSVFQYPTAIMFYEGKEVKRFEGAFAFDDFGVYMHRLMTLLEE